MISIRYHKKLYFLIFVLIVILSIYFISVSSYRKIESITAQSEELNRIYEKWLIVKNETVRYTINYPKIPYPLIESVSDYEIAMENLLNEKTLNLIEKSIPALEQQLPTMILMWQEIQFKLIKSLFFNQDIGFFANEVLHFITARTDTFEITMKNTLAIFNKYLSYRVKLNWILFIMGTTLSIFLAIVLGNLTFNYFKMAEKEREIRELSKSILEVRDQEQTRIAADLHDEIVQNLIYTHQISDNILQDKCACQSCNILDQISDMRLEIERNIRLVRNIAFNLRPPELSENLENSISYFLADIETKTHIKTDFHYLCQEDYPFDQDLEIMIYRLIYEAVNNSVKHSKASEIKVKIIPVFPNIIVRIEDNGIGFEYNSIQTEEHMGLKGMEGRVKTKNGSMKIKSELGKGTAVIFTIPDNRVKKLGKI